MTGILRFVGWVNAAVWCGSAIFMLAALPALFTPDLKKLLTSAGTGFAAEAVMGRYFIIQYCCGFVALAHLAAEWFYFGRRWPRVDAALVIGMLAVTLTGGLWLQPKMRILHLVKYYGRTAAEQARAGRLFSTWHGVAEAVNLAVIVGLVIYLWRVGRTYESPRFVNVGKIRG